MPDEIVHIRLPTNTLKGLDGHIRALRKQGLPPRLTTRSTVVRTLLAAQLEIDPEANAAFESLLRTRRFLQLTTTRALKRVLEGLPNAIDEVAMQAAGATLQGIIAEALRRVVASGFPSAESITNEVLAEAPTARKR